ncbi:MAG: LysR family transcriptional regulator [Gammaproteobacteria bacterium]|nr:LysR family transcriptional regulator [Gammaproteobacteria bacterium]
MPTKAASARHLPSVKQLRYFTALEQAKHFGRAAAACHVSQPAFSAAIRELEETLGVSLVDRDNRRVTVTPLGHEVATQARLCLRDMEALVELAQEEKGVLVGKLTLGVIPTIAPFMLPQLLPALRRAYPHLQLFLREDVTAELVQSLLDGQVDLVLMALPYDMRNVETEILFRDPFRLACREGTERVDPRHYKFNRLQQESVLLLEDGHCLRDHALAACHIRRSEKVNPIAASSLLTLVQMVDADLGITFLPAMAEGSALLANTRVKTYPLDKDAYREIGLVWRRGSRKAAEYKQLAELIRGQKGK